MDEIVSEQKIKRTEEDEDSETEVGPSPIIKIMVEKHQDIENSISLIKKEIKRTEATDKDTLKQPDECEFNGLVNLLNDSRVDSMISSLAGSESQSIIKSALGSINSGKDKQEALTEGIEKLRLAFAKPEKSATRDNPAVAMALGLVGLTKNDIIKRRV